VAPLKPFFRGTTLFSTISPEYERELKTELFACATHLHIPITTLYKMPIRDRKYYIKLHNEEMEKRNGNAGSHSRTITGEEVNKYAGV
jgi:hypothetical protein